MKKKFIIKAMYVCLVVNSLFSIPIVAKTKPPKSIPGTAIFVMAELPTVKIEEKTFTFHLPNLFLSVSAPQFSGLKNKQFETSLNKQLIKDAKRNKEVFIEEAKAYQKDLGMDHLNPINFEYRESFVPIDTIQPFVVVEQFKYQYNGGAHGDSQYSYIVIDNASSKLITLKDLFKENVDYKSVINRKIHQMISEREKLGSFFFSGSDGFQGIKENQPFFINNRGELVIVFNVYEIAPYAAGVQYFPIHKADLAPYLK